MRPIITSLLLLASSPAVAQSTIAIAPVFSQLVAMPIPRDFDPVFEDATDTQYISEAVPHGESVRDWSQMVTLIATRDYASGNAADDVLGFAESLADVYEEACPDLMAAEPLDAPPVPGAAASFAGFLTCGDNGTGYSESMVFIVFVGSRDIYALEWAVHGRRSDTPPPYDPAIWVSRMAELSAAARLCDPVPGEAPPYPSCLQ